MNHGLSDFNPGLPRPSSLSPPPSRFIGGESPFHPSSARSDDIDNLLSRPSLNKLHLECYDEFIYNDLPQYLLCIRDMTLYSREELWGILSSRLGTMIIDLEKARHTITQSDGKAKLRESCKDDVRQLLKYAIFSHRWGKEEPKFRDMSSEANGKRPTPESSGYNKLQNFCQKAEEYGCEYVWSDTCCINKESSSELEEAIRSMYRWYENAFVCIVHLARSSSVEDFAKEPWFTRGWTLQELLASKRLRIYGEHWRPICPKTMEARGGDGFPFPDDKRSAFMLHSISDITEISLKDIQDFKPSSHTMVSTKMRWASKRETTRTEDVAYSLLGIFDVVMPIAYGEGDRAFQRLLEAIAQRSGDPSFFAWAGTCSRHSLALPSSPASYQTVVTIPTPYCHHDYTIQKRGIHLRLLVIELQFIQSRLGYELQPKDTYLMRDMKVMGHFIPSPETEFDPKNSYAVGVVDFQPDPSGDHNVGCLLRTKSHFGIFMQVTQGRAGSGFDLTCRRVDMNRTLLLIECGSTYRGALKTVLLQHTHFLYI